MYQQTADPYGSTYDPPDDGTNGWIGEEPFTSINEPSIWTWVSSMFVKPTPPEIKYQTT